jgi:5'-3' exonuclease
MIAITDGDPLVYMAAWGRTLPDAKEWIKQLIIQNAEYTFCDDYMIAVGSTENFRNEIYPLYKKSKSRANSRSTLPDWINELKDFLANQPNVYVCRGHEADDQVRIWAGEAKSAGDPFIVSTIDKDLDCIAGMHFNLKTKETYEVTEDYANFFYWKQLLMGDSVDNIPGLPGIGRVKAEKLLAGLTNHEDRKAQVIDQYIEYYGTEWENEYLANGKMIHMWRFMNDHFNLDI